MAGQSLRTSAPVSLSLSRSPNRPTLYRVPASTRTRHHHGAFTLGEQLGSVYSLRRAGQSYAVQFELGADTLQVASAMTPAQARSMARALNAAAAAVEAVSVSKGGVV